MSLFREAVKEGTFLHRYLHYMSPLETPLAYDFWCGLWLLSAAVERRVVVRRPKAPVYLNLYMILCANAGTTRKSTAIRMCEAVYRAAGFDEQALTVTGSITPEKLTAQLAQRTTDYKPATANIIVSELVTFLGKETYVTAMPGLLTDLYDCPAQRSYGRLSTGPRIINNIYVTFAAASTPSWLIRAINPDVIEGGFTSRCLFIIEEKRKRLVAWPDDAKSVGVEPLATDLQYVREQAARWSSADITLTDNAKARFVRWYENRKEDRTNDPFISSFEAREDHHILRLAALLSVNDDSWLIDTHHIGHAIKLIMHHKEAGAALFAANREGARLTVGLDKLRTVLLEAGDLGITQSDLLFRTRTALRTRELEYALTVMHEMEMVQRFDLPTGGRKKTIWRATNKILARSLNQLLTERLHAN